MSACERVFSITELAEHIFLELSMSDLLCRAQQTSRQWKAVIDESLLLQQALFLKPISYNIVERLAPNPLRFYVITSGDGSRPATTVEHPLLTKIGSGGMSLARLFAANLDAVCRPEASWRRCLITQPPVVNVRVYITNETNADKSIHSLTGVLLRELIPDDRAIRTLHASHIYSWVKWRKFWLGYGFYQLTREIRTEEQSGVTVAA